MNRLVVGVVSVALVGSLAACGGSSAKKPSSSGSVTFGTNASRDSTFISTLEKSQYASDYTSGTQQDLIQYANDFCQQLTSPPGSGLDEIMNLTPNSDAEKYFGTLAVNTYCPSAAGELSNFFG